ncbi:hypothetical protein [Bacillus sp. NPDC077027]|uniref:hypothetical protein n=1 Tax=Bacillus sp. NPDC077027 TaxID=3390548 RepID=UPI003CFDFAB0
MQPQQKSATSLKTKKILNQIWSDLQFAGFIDMIIEYQDIRPTLDVCVTAKKPRNNECF